MYTIPQAFAVLIAMIFMITCTWIIVHYTKHLESEKKIMFLLIYIASMVVNLWVVDNVIAFKIHLLDKEENDMVKQIILGIIGYGLGYVKAKSEDKQI